MITGSNGGDNKIFHERCLCCLQIPFSAPLSQFSRSSNSSPNENVPSEKLAKNSTHSMIEKLIFQLTKNVILVSGRPLFFLLLASTSVAMWILSHMTLAWRFILCPNIDPSHSDAELHSHVTVGPVFPWWEGPRLHWRAKKNPLGSLHGRCHKSTKSISAVVCALTFRNRKGCWYE